MGGGMPVEGEAAIPATLRLFILALAAGVAPAASAAEVVPGERQFSNDTKILPAYSTSAAPVNGEVLGSMSTPFEVRDAEIPDRIYSGGTFTARVIREPGRPGLTFDYDLDETAFWGPSDIGPIEIAGFGTFSTDVRSRVLAEEEEWLSIIRSADGDLLRFEYDSEGLDEYLIIRTNAPGFAPDGLMSVHYVTRADDFGTIPFPTFRPVPEPGTCALVAAPLALARRRRSRR
jgi:hypothetical protein